MATLPASSYFNNAARTEAEFKQAQEDFLASVKQIPGAGVATLSNTIASGSITPAGSGGVIVIDTEAAAATDDLTNIVTTNYPDGSMLLIRNSNASRFVVVKHAAGGSGQMNLDQSGEYTLDDTKKWLLLQRRSADWHEVFRGPQRPLPVQSPIINGAMEVWQRGTTFAALASGALAADRWKREGTSGGVATFQRSTSVPTVTQAGVLFNYSLEVDVTTADASVASTDVETLTQRIEGYNWRLFAQRQFTLSFWVYSTKTGTHCVSFRNTGDDRSYVATYSVAVTNTWEYKTVTVAPSPSGGSWDYTNGSGLTVSFCLMAGTNFHTTAGAWQTSGAALIGTSAQANVFDNVANFFRITGVRMELGPIATPYSFVDMEDELSRCMRYYQKSFQYATAPATNSGTLLGAESVGSPVGASATLFLSKVTFATVMRGTPSSVVLYNPSAANNQIRNTTNSTDGTSSVAENISSTGFRPACNTSGSTAVGHSHQVHWSADAEL